MVRQAHHERCCWVTSTVVRISYAAGKQEDVGGNGGRQELRRWPRAQTVDVSVSKIGVQPQPAIIALTARDLGSQT